MQTSSLYYITKKGKKQYLISKTKMPFVAGKTGIAISLEYFTAQYFIKRNRLIVPMHTPDIVTAGFKAILSELLFYQFFLFIFFGIMRMPMEMDGLIAISDIKRNIIVTYGCI